MSKVKKLSLQYIRLECHKEPYKTIILDLQTRYVAVSVVTDTQIHTDTHTDRMTTITLTHAPRVIN